MPTAKAKSFTATLEKLHDGLGWTIARIPFDPTKTFPKMVRLRVSGTINGFAFRTSLFPFRESPGHFFLLVNHAMQQGSDSYIGDTASFTLSADLAPRPAHLPPELDHLLDEAEGLRDFYNEFTEYQRREIGKWISIPKSPASRVHRSEILAERLLATMEAEVELPPLILRALGNCPGAMNGWQLLTPMQRRNGLMAVFHYQTPEARQKRAEKLAAQAAAKSAAKESR